METAEVLIPSPLLKPDSISSSLPAKTSCPWEQIKVVEAVSLNDVMSEQLAKSLVEENAAPSLSENVLAEDLIGCGEITDCSDDYLLAKMLQDQFDKEHDTILKQEESKYNKDHKVKVSYGKYLRCPQYSSSSDEDDDREYFLEQNAKNHWQNLEKAEKDFQTMGKSGLLTKGTTVTTKHDPTLSGRLNAGKLMKLPPGMSTGDVGMSDIKLSNAVYNSLRVHSKSEQKRAHKIHEKKEKSTTERALDENTHLILYKLINNQTLDSLNGCISVGKEACVYHAFSGLPEGESQMKELAIKVYKTTLNEFHNRAVYIKNDHRFRHRFTKQNPQKIIHIWAEKEMRNLLRMKEANLPCPEVVILKKHVLVMSFIGKNMLPAPKLKDVELPFADMTILYEQTIEIMKILYSKCNLIHADLSEYNLLVHDDKVWVIDVSQSLDTTDPASKEFLLRDCTNITSFFSKKGVLNVHTPESLFTEICYQLPKTNSETKESQSSSEN